MEKENFIAGASALLAEKAQKQNYSFVFYAKGFTSDLEEEQYWIATTNLKYFKTENTVLMGDFFRLRCNRCYRQECRFYLQELYDSYLEGGWDYVSQIADKSLGFAKAMAQNGVFKFLAAGQYESLKDRLILRPLDHRDSLCALNGFVYRRIGDIALALYLMASDERKNNIYHFTSFKIPKKMTLDWGIPEDEFWNAALANTYVHFPPRIYINLTGHRNPPYSQGAFMASDSKITGLSAEDFPTLTTTSHMNGAIALFYPGVMERIWNLFGGDYYVVFTSMHEALLHKKDSVKPLHILKRLKSVNSSFDRGDTLNKKIYLYKRSSGGLRQLEL